MEHVAVFVVAGDLVGVYCLLVEVAVVVADEGGVDGEATDEFGFEVGFVFDAEVEITRNYQILWKI